jgi:hypothetical protein
MAVSSSGLGLSAIVANGGLAPSPSSALHSGYGVDLALSVIDDPQLLWTELADGELDAVATTVDAWAAGKSSVVGHGGADAVLFLGFSQGADGVLLRGVNGDDPGDPANVLADSTIAATPLSATRFLVDDALAGLSVAQQVDARAKIIPADDPSQALGLLLANQANAASTSEPNLSANPPASMPTRRLFTTGDRPNLIAEIVVVRHDVLESNGATVCGLIQGLIASGTQARSAGTATADLLHLALDVPTHVAWNLVRERTLANLADNVRFFGLDGTPSRYVHIYLAAAVDWGIAASTATALASRELGPLVAVWGSATHAVAGSHARE